MKIATNVHRDAFGGITISNLALFDWLEDKQDTIVGIEFITNRHIKGAIIFRRYLPSFFSHHIVNCLDIFSKYSWEKSYYLKKKWKILIETTKDILKKESPDIILINGTYFAPWILAQAAKELKIPIVLRYAGVLQKEIAHKNFFIRKKLLAYEKWIAQSADTIIFPSLLCKDVVEKEVVKSAIKKYFIIPNPSEIKTKNKRQKTKHFTIAAIGRWTPVKNFSAFVATHNALREKKMPHRAILVTSHQNAKCTIPKTIEFRSSMNQEELQKFYRSIDLLIVPSHFETFCNVAAEALVTGTSVLVSRNVGFSEILLQAGLERMVINSFDNPQETARAIEKISKQKITKKEKELALKLLDPHKIHYDILTTLNSTLHEAKNFNKK